MRLAIIADWLVTFGGAEHALAEFRVLWPSAPIFTTVVARKHIGPLKDADIRTTRLQRLYQIIGNHQFLLPLMPRAIEDSDLRGFDVILSSSHAVAKGIVPPSTAVHICYCHTPMRYGWEMEEAYLEDFHVPRFLRGHLKEHLKKLRRWDLTTAKRVDHFIANSTETRERIARIYARDSVVIPPPVDERFFKEPLKADSCQLTAPRQNNVAQQQHERSYYVAVGRLVPYKRFDLLIETANALKLPLKIAGVGRELQRLKKRAGPTVQFLGHVDDENLPTLYLGATALLFPQHEDAGIVPLEAQACGTPVIAFERGGVRDSVIDGTTGVTFSEQTVDALRDALKRFKSIEWNRAIIQEHARKFSQENFRRRMKEEVEQCTTTMHIGTSP